MSMVDLDLFGAPPEDDELHPEFAKVLLGFDPRHVEEFVSQTEDRIATLERQLQESRTQLDAATRRLTTAREEAYGDVAGKMAELLRAADHYAEKLRRETDENSRRILAEAAQQAEQIRRDAEAEADSNRAEAEAELREAKAEADRLLGQLGRQRDVLVDVLQGMRSNMLQLVADLDATTAEAQAPTAFTLDFEEQPIVPGVDDLLGTLEGFELAQPAPFGQDQEDEEAGPEEEEIA
jgi:cell division septum initiation protein DivIVA